MKSFFIILVALILCSCSEKAEVKQKVQKGNSKKINKQKENIKQKKTKNKVESKKEVATKSLQDTYIFGQKLFAAQSPAA